MPRQRRFDLSPLALAVAGFSLSLPAFSQDDSTPRSRLDLVQVTATRFGEQVQEVPGSVSVITGEELSARGATDLRTALALLGGVSVAPGGDNGPSAAVPGLLGLREVDDLLLLVDGIPAGGAFIPRFETLSLNNVERIEVLRGAAPVYFGTTAFAGTINIVHYPAGKAASELSVAYGSFGSASLRGSTVLSDSGLRQSISGELSDEHSSDSHSGTRRAQLSYRLATDMAGGRARADINLISLRQKPTSPTPVDAQGQLSRSIPVDFNQNPADARLDTDSAGLVLGYEKTLSLGQWGTTLALTRSRVRTVQGFLIDDFDEAEGDNAQGASQSRQLTDVFFDTHLTSRLTPALSLTYGLNELYGRATQDSRSFSYGVALDGSGAASSTAATPLDSTTLADRRSFFGLYAQSRWAVTSDASLLAGLRWNHAQETRDSGDADDTTRQQQRTSRFSGSIGGQVKVWQDKDADFDDVSLHASLGNTFQLPQIDFGPDAGADPLLRPETQRSLEFGVKADGFDGRFDLDLTAFLVDFRNQAISTVIDGNPALVSGGSQRFKGVEIEGSYRLLPELTIAAHVSHNDARYRDFTTLIGGVDTQLAGNSLVMSPKLLGGLGLTYAPPRGWRGSMTASYTGRRYLDALNSAEASSYVVADASIGYAFDRYRLELIGSNLGDRRDPVLPSELGEGQFYRLPGRRIMLALTVSLQ